MADERENESESSVEGVRIVDKDEAQAALDAGVAISRQSQGRLVSIVNMETDEPQPTWADTDDASPSIRIVGSTSERVSSTLRMPDSMSSTGAKSISHSDVIDDDFDLLDLRASDDPTDDPKVVHEEDPRQGLVTPPQTHSHPLPHWTEAPSGEVPKVLEGGSGAGDEPTKRWSLDDLSDASKLGESDDDLDAAFDALGEEPPIEPEQLADEAEVAKATDESETMKADDSPSEWSKQMDAIEEKVESLKKASIVSRTITAVAGVAIATAAFSAGPAWAMFLSLVVVMLCAVEYFDALRRVGYKPATALGLVAVFGAMLGTYARGEAAIPLVFALATAFTFLWYLTGVIKDSPTANISVTLLGVMWIGIFGSYAAVLLRAPDHRGVAFLGAAVVLVIVYDTFAYLGGVLFGKHKLIPSISPGKTWEGLIVATAVTVLVGTVVVPFIHPWGIWQGMIFGLVVACVSPLGDLAESMIKRDLGLKDMGHLLPGHGGALDRFDALLFVLPATYYVVRLFNLV